MALTIDTSAPAFTLPDQDGRTHSLADYTGRWLLIYFYPKDDTPGCTAQACSIRDSMADFQKAGLAVLGVSVDPIKKHQKFVEKYHLNFPLLSDEDKQMVAAYDVWGMKKFMGREYMGTHRVSYLINPAGTIVRVYDPVKTATHGADVLADFAALQAG